jgi:hypothetical protein
MKLPITALPDGTGADDLTVEAPTLQALTSSRRGKGLKDF